MGDLLRTIELHELQSILWILGHRILDMGAILWTTAESERITPAGLALKEASAVSPSLRLRAIHPLSDCLTHEALDLYCRLQKGWNMDVGCFRQVLLLSLVQDWRTVMLQLSGFDCNVPRTITHLLFRDEGLTFQMLCRCIIPYEPWCTLLATTVLHSYHSPKKR